MIGTLRQRIEKFHSDVKAARQHCNQQESAIESFKSDIQRIVPVILDPTELRAEVGKLVAANDAQGGLKPWLDADVEVQALIVTTSFPIPHSLLVIFILYFRSYTYHSSFFIPHSVFSSFCTSHISLLYTALKAIS